MMYDTRVYTPDGSGHGTGQVSNDKELVLQAMREYGQRKAAELQEASTGMTGDCCTDGGKVWRSTIDNNVWSPDTYPQGWTDLGPVGGPFVEEEA